MSALITYRLESRINPVSYTPFPRSAENSFYSFNSCSTRKISCSPFPRSAEHSCYSCSQKNLVFTVLPVQRRKFVSFEKFVFKKNLVFKVPSRAAQNIRVIRVIRVQKKNPVSSSPFPRQRGTFVSFELFVFKRKIPCSQENYPCSHPHAKIIKIH